MARKDNSKFKELIAEYGIKDLMKINFYYYDGTVKTRDAFAKESEE